MISFKIHYKGTDKVRNDFFYIMNDGGVMRSSGHIITNEVDLYYKIDDGEWIKIKHENYKD